MVKNDIKQEIIKLYYEEHKRPVDIASIINNRHNMYLRWQKKIYDMKVKKSTDIINLWKRRKRIVNIFLYNFYKDTFLYSIGVK